MAKESGPSKNSVNHDEKRRAVKQQQNKAAKAAAAARKSGDQSKFSRGFTFGNPAKQNQSAMDRQRREEERAAKREKHLRKVEEYTDKLLAQGAMIIHRISATFREDRDALVDAVVALKRRGYFFRSEEDEDAVRAARVHR